MHESREQRKTEQRVGHSNCSMMSQYTRTFVGRCIRESVSHLIGISAQIHVLKEFLVKHPISSRVNFDTDIIQVIRGKQFGELGPWNQNGTCFTRGEF